MFCICCFLDENTLVITEKSVNASCDQKVTLNCSISHPVEVLQYSWTYGNVTLCEYKNNMENCSYTDNQELLLNIQQVNPSHSGKYVCMLLADSGHGTKDTQLHVLGGNQNSASDDVTILKRPPASQ